jgi:hypothetical protein
MSDDETSLRRHFDPILLLERERFARDHDDVLALVGLDHAEVAVRAFDTHVCFLVAVLFESRPR